MCGNCGGTSSGGSSTKVVAVPAAPVVASGFTDAAGTGSVRKNTVLPVHIAVVSLVPSSARQSSVITSCFSPVW